MNEKKEVEFEEIIELLTWAYKQGYLHASQVLKETVPNDSALSKMFVDALKNRKQEVTEK